MPSVLEGNEPAAGIKRTVLLAALALFVGLCGPALRGLIYTADDLSAFHLPLRSFYAGSLENGDAFDWSPGLFGGFYLTGEGQAGTYHPLHLLLYRFLPLAWAWNLECLLSYPFMFGGLWLLLRRRGFGQGESLFGAMAFTFGSFSLLHFVHVNAIAVVAHMPWLLVAIDRLAACRRTDWQSVLLASSLIAALTGSQVLLGYPQYVLYSLIAEALYLLFVFRERRFSAQSPATIKLTAIWLAAKLLGLALAAVQVLPTIEALGDSVRQSGDSTFSSSGSLHPLNFVQLVAPYLFATRVVGQNTHELALYVGCVPLLLAIVAVANRRSQHISHSSQTVLWFALALVALGSVIALGKHGPLHRWLGILPLVGYFRFPCRAIVLLQLGIGLLAAIGFAVLADKSYRARSIVFPHRTVGLIVLAGVAAAAGGPLLWPEHIADARRIWLGPILLFCAAALVMLAAKGSRWALHSMIVLTAIDLGAYGLSYAAYRDTPTYSQFLASIAVPPGVAGQRVALDLAAPNTQSLRAGNQILLRGFTRIDGYAGLTPARRLDYRQRPALRVAGVTAVATDAPVTPGLDVAHGASNGWLEVADSLPRARLVYSCQPTADPAADIAHINVAQDVLIQINDCPIVVAHLGETSTGVLGADQLRILTDRPGKIVVESDSSRPAVLVVNESFHRGWTAVAQGPQPPQDRELETLPVNGDFLACLVPEGRFFVEFRFAPTSLRTGRAISICSLGLLVLLTAAATWRRAVSARRL